MDKIKVPKHKTTGKSNIGRPRRRWTDQIHLESLGTGTTPKILRFSFHISMYGLQFTLIRAKMQSNRHRPWSRTDWKIVLIFVNWRTDHKWNVISITTLICKYVTTTDVPFSGPANHGLEILPIVQSFIRISVFCVCQVEVGVGDNGGVQSRTFVRNV